MTAVERRFPDLHPTRTGVLPWWFVSLQTELSTPKPYRSNPAPSALNRPRARRRNEERERKAGAVPRSERDGASGKLWSTRPEGGTDRRSLCPWVNLTCHVETHEFHTLLRLNLQPSYGEPEPMGQVTRGCVEDFLSHAVPARRLFVLVCTFQLSILKHPERRILGTRINKYVGTWVGR